MNWNDAEELMKTARNPEKGKPIGSNTRLYFDDAGVGHYNIRLHGNIIMRIYSDRIVPTDGGWQTVTTKARLNEYLPRGFRVFQKNWVWYLEDTYVNISFPFSDVFYISTKDYVQHSHHEWSSKVMLHSTRPKYPEVYEKGEDELDWDAELETGEEHQEYEPSFDTNIDQELYSLRKGW